MAFDRQPTLSSGRVRVRPLRREDFEALFSVSSDPKLWDQHPESDRWQRPVFEKFFEKGIESGGALAILDASGRVVGTTRFYDYSEERREVAIGFTFIARELWATGFNAELKKLLLEYSFREVERVIFHVGDSNLRSQRAVEKLGARRIGTVPRKRHDGTSYESFVFELVREEPRRS